MHFVLVFDRPFTGFGTWLGSELSPDSTAATGTRAGGYVTFDTTSRPVVQMELGLSFVSIANAEANLDAENPGWDFDAIRTQAASRWNEVLNRIQVEGGTDEERTKFYTALYHVFQNPNVASDVNGASPWASTGACTRPRGRGTRTSRAGTSSVPGRT